MPLESIQSSIIRVIFNSAAEPVPDNLINNKVEESRGEESTLCGTSSRSKGGAMKAILSADNELHIPIEFE